MSSRTGGRCSRYARPPTSCSALYPSYEAHPLPALRDAGVRVTLGSDDPPYWDASIGGEYAVAAEHMGFDDEALREVTRTALRAAFVEEEVRQRLLDVV